MAVGCSIFSLFKKEQHQRVDVEAQRHALHYRKRKSGEDTNKLRKRKKSMQDQQAPDSPRHRFRGSPSLPSLSSRSMANIPLRPRHEGRKLPPQNRHEYPAMMSGGLPVLPEGGPSRPRRPKRDEDSPHIAPGNSRDQDQARGYSRGRPAERDVRCEPGRYRRDSPGRSSSMDVFIDGVATLPRISVEPKKLPARYRRSSVSKEEENIGLREFREHHVPVQPKEVPARSRPYDAGDDTHWQKPQIPVERKEVHREPRGVPVELRPGRSDGERRERRPRRRESPTKDVTFALPRSPPRRDQSSSRHPGYARALSPRRGRSASPPPRRLRSNQRRESSPAPNKRPKFSWVDLIPIGLGLLLSYLEKRKGEKVLSRREEHHHHRRPDRGHSRRPSAPSRYESSRHQDRPRDRIQCPRRSERHPARIHSDEHGELPAPRRHSSRPRPQGQAESADPRRQLRTPRSPNLARSSGSRGERERR